MSVLRRVRISSLFMSSPLGEDDLGLELPELLEELCHGLVAALPRPEDFDSLDLVHRVAELFDREPFRAVELILLLQGLAERLDDPIVELDGPAVLVLEGELDDVVLPRNGVILSDPVDVAGEILDDDPLIPFRKPARVESGDQVADLPGDLGVRRSFHGGLHENPGRGCGPPPGEIISLMTKPR